MNDNAKKQPEILVSAPRPRPLSEDAGYSCKVPLWGLMVSPRRHERSGVLPGHSPHLQKEGGSLQTVSKDPDTLRSSIFPLQRYAAAAVIGLLVLALAGCNTGVTSGPPAIAVTTQVAPTSTLAAPTQQQATPITTVTEWVPPTALVGTPRPGAVATLTAAPRLKTGPLTITNKQGEMVNMTVEIADDDPSRELGLMHRAQMDPNAGMLFLWTEDVDGGFWMYNTILPLSIAFIAADGTILNVEDMAALDTNTTRPAGSYRYALETNQGFFRAHNIVAGDKVTLPNQQSVVIPGLPSCCCDPSAAAP